MNKEQTTFKEALLFLLQPCNYNPGKVTIVGGMQGARYSITPIMDEEKGTPLVSDLLLHKSAILQEWYTLEFHAGDFFENPHIPTREEINLFLLTNKDMADFIVYSRDHREDCWEYGA